MTLASIYAVAIQSSRRITPEEWDAAATIELAVMKRVPVHVDYIDALPDGQGPAP